MQRGQASVEWLGAVALVALLLAAGGLVATRGGEAIAASVVRGIERALCIVTGGVCDLDSRPCPVDVNHTLEEAHANAVLVRVGRREIILREHLSDGTVLVTYIGDTQFGAEGGFGADVEIALGDKEAAASLTARAALLTSLGSGETWVFDNAMDADVAMSQLGEGHEPTLGVRASRFSGTATEVEIQGDAQVKLDDFEIAAGGALSAENTAGIVVDARTGRRTHVIRRSGDLRAFIQHEEGGAEGAVEAGEQLTVTTAPDGTPLELGIVRSGELAGTLDLPETAQAAAESLLGGTSGHRRWVVERRLDLTDPDNLAAAEGLLRALDGPVPELAYADDALRSRLDEAGVTEVRTYDVEGERHGASGHFAAVLKVGGGVFYESENAHLIGARVRGPDGVWRDNPACTTTV